MNIAIIGFGYWGPNLVRNFNSISDCTVKYICDFRTERLNIAKKLYPNISAINDYQVALNDLKVDAVVIATPVFTHFELAKKSLLLGKHVLIEKPMTSYIIIH